MLWKYISEPWGRTYSKPHRVRALIAERCLSLAKAVFVKIQRNEVVPRNFTPSVLQRAFIFYLRRNEKWAFMKNYKRVV